MIVYPMLAFKMSQKDISQQDLANMIGMNRGTLHMKLSGRHGFQEYEKYKIACALGCETMNRAVLFVDREGSRAIEASVTINTRYDSFFVFLDKVMQNMEKKKEVKADDAIGPST